MTFTLETPCTCPNDCDCCGRVPGHDVNADGRHPSVQAVTRFFDWGHLPPALQQVSAGFAALAESVLDMIPEDDPELTVALRKLLEAKDAAVRAAVATR